MKIASIGNNADGSAVLYAADTRIQQRVDAQYVAKHKPEVGGYFVQYEDGYLSFSPAAAFESGYTEVRAPKVKVCGVDCRQGDEHCNGYCIGKSAVPPAA
jgi:hypothetical protein